MELVSRFIFGGPDRRLFPPAWKRALKESVAGVEVPGLDTLDVAFRFGGSVSSFEGDQGVHHVRFLASRRRVTVNVVVPASELAELGADALAPHLDELARAVARRVAPGQVDDVAGVLSRAFREVPSPPL